MKGVPFDVINCNLKRKPKFLVDANPDGSVPVLLHDEKVLYESEAIVGETPDADPCRFVASLTFFCRICR